MPHPDLTEIPKKQLAEWLGLTTRQVTNLADQGMPRRAAGHRVFFPWPEALHWYIQNVKDGARSGDDEKQKLTTRRLQVEVDLAELALAKEREQVVTLDYMEEQLRRPLERLRAKLLNVPGKYAPAMVGLRSTAEAQTRLEGMVAEAMGSLSDTGEDPYDDDEDDDSAEREAAVA